MTEIHNAELTQDIVIGAVAAWLEQTNDSALRIDISFQRNISHASNQDLIAFTKIDILKANDFQPMKRGQHAWIDEDQKLLGEMTMNKPNGKDNTAARTYKKSTQTAKQPFSAESDSLRDKKITGNTLKHVAVQWELPSAEYYPVRYEEHIRRNLNIRKTTELETAQEVPAVREKGEANDQTDQDCLTHPNDLHSSRESLSFTIESKRERSPIRQQLSAPVKAAAIPKKQEEPVKDEPKVEEVKKVEEKEKQPLKEEPAPKLEEKKDEVKVVELKKEETPAIDVKNPVKKVQISTKRHPDSGELTILSEKDGIVSFTCSTRHRTKKSKKKDNEQIL